MQRFGMSKTNQKIVFTKFILSKKELIIAVAATLALLIALLAEKIGGIKPCKLCLYERCIYLNVIIFAILRLNFLKNQAIKYIFAISLIVLPLLSFYHVLYEKNYIKTSPICDSTLKLDNLNREQIKALILKEESPSCKAPVYVFKTISFAELNFYYSCVLLAIFMIRRNEKN